MTQEEKDLLLKDLSGRVRYGVRLWVKYFEKEPKHFIDAHSILGSVIYDRGSEYKISLIDKGEYNIEGHSFSNYEQVIKPYLRPMSSMTEEEQFQLGRLLGATSYNLLKGEYSSLKELLEYSYKNYIDLFGLIPKGLALEAPENMYE